MAMEPVAQLNSQGANLGLLIVVAAGKEGVNPGLIIAALILAVCLARPTLVVRCGKFSAWFRLLGDPKVKRRNL